MNPLLQLFLAMQPQTSLHDRAASNKFLNPSFAIRHDGRYQTLCNPWRKYFASELSVLELPFPHYSLIVHHLSTKDGFYLGYAVHYFITQTMTP